MGDKESLVKDGAPPNARLATGSARRGTTPSSEALAGCASAPGAVTDPPELPLECIGQAFVPLGPVRGRCALEDEAFPFEALSDVAEIESWRKEINRPPYHIHKWWAQRLGTVFRAMAIGAFAPKGSDLLELFYRPVRIPDAVVFDPFMGSGTTVGEALKLGARAIGRDINPVSHFLVRNALAVHDRAAILREFRAIERDVADRIRRFYRASLPNGSRVDVLYYFWVKVVDCPRCRTQVDLFSSRIFARHADPKRNPTAQAVCPHCGDVAPVRYDASDTRCRRCSRRFDPQTGPANRRKATCPSCAHAFPIAKTVRRGDGPPAHRLYAKRILLPNGEKAYLPATDEDRALYAEAERELAKLPGGFPVVPIEPGRNTNQALGYNYRYWHEMFNARQLLCLSILASRIREIADPALRDPMTCLFSGTLEFNNLFASYKGEGTGAVRHMFAHHILKPERVPLEAHPWGTPRSSGSFSTLFEGRITRALDYADNPFELRSARRNGRITGEKLFGLSEKIGHPLAADYGAFAGGGRVYLSCGDSSSTDIADASVDAVLTDPPFFDNVHYSQLADFFHVWQRHIGGGEGCQAKRTTRSPDEVQSADVRRFTVRLAGVLTEAHRVLKREGVLAFTYHHSRAEGWRSVLEALMTAGFGITATQPVKSEMSVAMPKRRAKEPIDLDVIVVCRKRSALRVRDGDGDPWEAVGSAAAGQVARFRDAGRRLSGNDIRVIVMAQLIRRLSMLRTAEKAVAALEASEDEIEARIAVLRIAGEGGVGGDGR